MSGRASPLARIAGALYVIGLFEAARHLRSCPGDFVGAMEAAISRMCFYGGAEEGDRTMREGRGARGHLCTGDVFG